MPAAIRSGLVALAMALRSARPLSAVPGLIVLEAPDRDAPAIRAGAAQISELLARSKDRIEVRIGAGSGVEDDRSRRYRLAEHHPVVQDLLKRFDADITGRELIDVQEWLARFRSEQGRDGGTEEPG